MHLKQQQNPLNPLLPESLSPEALFGDLPLVRWQFHIRMDPDASLPGFTGSAWRGLIGWQVQRLVCPFKSRPMCRDCTISKHCPYALLIEESTPLPGLSESPRGYVTDPGEPDAQGEQVLGLTLFGTCTRFLPVLIMAIFEGGRTGIGMERHPYTVARMEEMLPDGRGVPVPLQPEGDLSTAGPFSLGEWIAAGPEPRPEMEIGLLTPVRLRKRGKYMGEMDWEFYFASLVRRLEALWVIFGQGEPLGKERWLAVREGFRFNGKIEAELRWQDLARYSSRQRKKVPMGGLVGRVRLKDPSPVEVAWWRAAELVHVGKGAAMGLGKVKIF